MWQILIRFLVHTQHLMYIERYSVQYIMYQNNRAAIFSSVIVSNQLNRYAS